VPRRRAADRRARAVATAAAAPCSPCTVGGSGTIYNPGSAGAQGRQLQLLMRHSYARRPGCDLAGGEGDMPTDPSQTAAGPSAEVRIRSLPPQVRGGDRGRGIDRTRVGL
jgi:hypothetical protein